MSHRCLASMDVLAGVIGALSLMLAPVAGQAPSSALKTWTPPRVPWAGHAGFDPAAAFGGVAPLQDASFFLTGLLFWWPVVRPGRSPNGSRGR